MGINGGLYIANQNTSIQYNGNYNNYGVISILNNPLNQTKFDQFFQYPYYIFDIPSDIKKQRVSYYNQKYVIYFKNLYDFCNCI